MNRPSLLFSLLFSLLAFAGESKPQTTPDATAVVRSRLRAAPKIVPPGGSCSAEGSLPCRVCSVSCGASTTPECAGGMISADGKACLQEPTCRCVPSK